MCGIFASVGFPPDRANIDVVAHRGPDGAGWREFSSGAGPVALGHRRLAIIDVSDGGLQPAADPDGRYHITFNGEIYNYLELRQELQRKHEVFQTESDTEVLLRAFMVWGPSCLTRLRGMFAFAIWDCKEQTLFVARDPFGIKPLYVASTRNGVAFGSEIKQLLGLPGLSRRMNIARVHDFLSSGISDHTAETMFADVRQVRGGEYVLVTTAGGGNFNAHATRWYAASAASLNLSEKEAAERFRSLLADSVRLHLRSDVPVGSCLSGGLDSSALVCLMAEMLGPNTLGGLHTVSACYSDKSVDEKPFMDAVVSHTGAMPHFIFPRVEDLFQAASDITWHQDEPFGSTSIFAQWCVFKEAKRQGIKVMLDGQGADEQLAGYHGAFPFHLAALIRRGRIGEAISVMSQRRTLHGADWRDQLPSLGVQLLPAWAAVSLKRAYQKRVRHDWLNTKMLQTVGNRESALSVAGKQLGLDPVVDLRTLCLTMTFSSNLPMLLHWEDRNSMAHSIEARVPFLDSPLVEFSLGLGNDHKIVGAETKRVLRQGLSSTLPSIISQRRDKLGFATPEENWFRGPLKRAMLDGVENTLRRFPDLTNGPAVRKLAREMLGGERRVDFSLWRIVSLGLWGERFAIVP